MLGARDARNTPQGRGISRLTRHLKWTKDEDSMLEHLVALEGTRDWATISEQMTGRNPRQCKERWENYLRRDLRHTDWTSEEDRLLFRKYEEFGPKWVHIARFFPNRTDSMVKTRFNLIKRHEHKRIEMLQEQTTFMQMFQTPSEAPEPPQEDLFEEPAPFDTFGEIYDPCDWDAGYGSPSFDIFDLA
jgi:hypothetical protein